MVTFEFDPESIEGRYCRIPGGFVICMPCTRLTQRLLILPIEHRDSHDIDHIIGRASDD